MLNANSSPDHPPQFGDDSWLDQVLQYLVDTHSPRVMGDLSFDVITSRYSVWCRWAFLRTFQALTFFFSGPSHPPPWRLFPMEMGDFFHWT